MASPSKPTHDAYPPTHDDSPFPVPKYGGHQPSHPGPFPFNCETVVNMLQGIGLPLVTPMPDGGCLVTLTTPRDRETMGDALPAPAAPQQQEEKEEAAAASPASYHTTTEPEPESEEEEEPEPERKEEGDGGEDGARYIWPEHNDGYCERGATRT